MNTTLTAGIVFGCLVAAVLVGRILRRVLPEEHLTADSRDTIKLAMGLVATMTALVLGLLVSSAKGAYDTKRSEVIEMAAKAAFFDRVLTNYGPEAAGARAGLHEAVKEAVRQMWPGAAGIPAHLAPNTQAGNAVYSAVEGLSRHDDTQRKLKDQATTLATDFAQLRSLLVAQFHFAAEADYPCLLAGNHFSWLQRARAAQCYCHPGFDGFRPRCLRRYFSDPGARPALWRADPDLQRANAQRLAPVREMRPIRIPGRR